MSVQTLKLLLTRLNAKGIYVEARAGTFRRYKNFQAERLKRRFPEATPNVKISGFALQGDIVDKEREGTT